MKAATFDYRRARDVPEALGLLAEGRGAARVLAGGQSLGPMLNLRLARPERLVDVSRIAPLLAVEETADEIVYGAGVTHAAFEDGRVPDACAGLLRHVAGGIAYRAIRNRGTVGGSLAHADPAADWPAALTAAGATAHAIGPAGERGVGLPAFVHGAFATDLDDDELLVAVAVPRASASARWGWHKICRKVGEFAEAIGAVVVDPERGACRVVAGATGGAPLLLESVADALAGRGAAAADDAVDAALAAALPDADPVDRHLHAIAVRRAIAQATR